MLVRDPPYPTPVRRLIYAGVPLTLAEAGNPDLWVLPCGSGVATTKELYAKARKAGVWCVLFERLETGAITYD
jgi:hypothetical protein